MSASFGQDGIKRRIENTLATLNTKKARVDAQSSLTAASISFPSNAALTGTTTANRGDASTNEFRPWNRDDLLARISTFKIQTWLVQSCQFTPVKCARNGWVNDDYSTLKCPICNSIIIAQIPDDLTDAEEEQWIDRLTEQLQTSHSSKCPWKGRECAEYMYGLPLATSRETVDSVCNVAADLLSFGSNLPKTKSPLSAFQRNLLCDLKSKTLEIQDSLSSSDDRSSKHAFSALVLSLFGWRVDRSISQPTVKCDTCFRSAGLWLFKPVDGVKDRGSGGGSSDGVEGKTDSLSDFDVVSEHRSFCWWTHATKQSNTTLEVNAPIQSNAAAGATIPGWKKVIGSILRAKTIGKAEEASSSDKDYSNSDESESSDTDGDKGLDHHSTTVNNVDDMDHDAETGALKRFKSFNISAISSAAEAFGIKFSTSLLAEAARRLREPVATQASGTEIIEAGIQASLQDDWGSDTSSRLGIEEDSVHAVERSAADALEDEIPAPIDISGLASLLGDSTLASALEDPAKAQLILEYVKGLLKEKNREAAAAALSNN